MFIREIGIETEEQQSPRYMAIDYGTKFIGLASFFKGIDPFPICYDRIHNKSNEDSINQITALIDLEQINIIILGIPFLLDGKETKMTKTIKDIGKNLSAAISNKKLNCELLYQDETLTTYEAEERMKNSPLYNFRVDLSKIDSLSAKIILEDFLASHNSLH